MAGALVMLGSVFVVLSAYDKVTRLRSLESREQIESVLAGDFGSSSGLSVESMIEAGQVIAIVAALGAVTAVALGWQVLQRSSGARIGLSVLAPFLLVVGLLVDGFTAALVVAATIALWISPSREWFAGEPIPEPGKRPRQGMQVWEQTPNQPTNGPREMSASSGSSSAPAGWSVSGSPSDQRPQPLTIAVVLMVVVAAGIFIVTLISLALLISQPEVLLEEVRRQDPELADSGVTDSLLITTSYVSGGIILLWSALTVTMAVLAAGRRPGAARGLMVCAIVCAAFSLVATFASAGALIPAVAALVTISCLRRPEVRAWFSGPRQR